MYGYAKLWAVTTAKKAVTNKLHNTIKTGHCPVFFVTGYSLLVTRVSASCRLSSPLRRGAAKRRGGLMPTTKEWKEL